MRSSRGMASVPWKSWAVLDRRRTKAISMYLAGNRNHFLQKIQRGKGHNGDQRRNELLRVARRAFRLESADVQRLYYRKVAGGVEASGGIRRRRLREKQAAPAHGGGKKSGGVEASGGIPWGVLPSPGIASFVAKFLTRAPTTPVAKSAPTTPPIRRSSSPGPVQTRCEEVPSMNGDLHLPDAHTRDEAQAVAQHEPYSCIFGTSGSQGALPVTTAQVLRTQTIAPDQQMLACGDVTAGRLRTPSWGPQHFEIRGSGPQAKVHSCIVSHIVDLRALYGDIAAADVLGASLRGLHLFESALGLTDSRGTESGSQVRGDKVASQVKAAAILGLAIKMVVSTDCTDKVPVARLWAKVAGNANVALVKALEIQLVNQWPGLVQVEY